MDYLCPSPELARSHLCRQRGNFGLGGRVVAFLVFAFGLIALWWVLAAFNNEQLKE